MSVSALNEVLLTELSEKEIVLLGNPQPNHRSFLQKVPEFLEYWIREASESTTPTSIPTEIVLALEMDSIEAHLVADYMVSGDMSLVLAYLIDEELKFGTDSYTYLIRTAYRSSLSIDYFQFLRSLEGVHRALRVHNQTTGSRKLSLHILGCEGGLPMNYRQFRESDSSEILSQWQSWYAYERDRASAMRLTTFLENHPRCKALVFYSRPHLRRDSVDKSWSVGRSVGSLQQSYYLAHYLDSLIGRQQVCVMDATYLPTEYVLNQKPERHLDRMIHEPLGPDYVLHDERIPREPFPFFFIKTRNTLGTLLELARYYQELGGPVYGELAAKALRVASSGLRMSHLAVDASARRELDKCMATLSATQIDDREVLRIKGALSVLVSRFDAMEDIRALGKVMEHTPMPRPSDYYDQFLIVLNNIPEKYSTNEPIQLTIAPKLLRDDDNPLQERWESMKDAMGVYSYISVLSLQDDHEREKTMDLLRQVTGMDYHTAPNWNDWWDRLYVGS